MGARDRLSSVVKFRSMRRKTRHLIWAVILSNPLWFFLDKSRLQAAKSARG